MPGLPLPVRDVEDNAIRGSAAVGEEAPLDLHRADFSEWPSPMWISQIQIIVISIMVVNELPHFI
jgi:hypothetical protein